MRKNANEITYSQIMLFGKDALLSEERIDRATIPAGIYCYDIRHADSDWGAPASIEPRVLVNWYGSVLVKEAIPMKDTSDAYRDCTLKDIVELGTETLLADWIDAKGPVNMDIQSPVRAKKNKSYER